MHSNCRCYGNNFRAKIPTSKATRVETASIFPSSTHPPIAKWMQMKLKSESHYQKKRGKQTRTVGYGSIGMGRSYRKQQQHQYAQNRQYVCKTAHIEAIWMESLCIFKETTKMWKWKWEEEVKRRCVHVIRCMMLMSHDVVKVNDWKNPYILSIECIQFGCEIKLWSQHR